MLPTCIKCGGHIFEEQEQNISYKTYYFVQCSNCGGVVSATDHKVLRELRDLTSKINNIEHEVHQVKNNM